MSVRVPLAVASCDFRRSGTRLRSTLALCRDRQQELMSSLQPQGVTGFVQLHTCNRIEWWVSAHDVDWACQLLQTAWRQCLDGYADSVDPELFRGASAAEHIFRVAVGLESLVQGEREIGGQVRRALQEARDTKRSSPALNIVAGAAGRLAAKVRKNPSDAISVPGMHTLVAEHLQATIPPGSVVIVVGMGVIGKRCAETLQNRGYRVRRFNRTPDPQGHYEPIHELQEAVTEVAAVVVCTASPEPLLTGPEVHQETAPLIVDLGSPAQVGSDLAKALDTRYLDLDGLTASHGVVLGGADAQRYEQLVADAVTDYVERLAHHRFRGLAQSNQVQLQQVLMDDLPELLDRYAQGLSPRKRRSLEVELRRLFRRQAWSIRESLVALDQAEEPPPFRLPYPENEPC